MQNAIRQNDENKRNLSKKTVCHLNLCFDDDIIIIGMCRFVIKCMKGSPVYDK